MPFIGAIEGQPYMNGLGVLASRAGAWLAIGGGLSRIAWEFDFALGAGNVTGSIYVEHTAQLNGTMPAAGARVTLPAGSLHTTLATAVLAANQVTLTGLTTGRLSLMLGELPPGNVRAMYVFGSGTGAAPNTVSCWCTGS